LAAKLTRSTAKAEADQLPPLNTPHPFIYSSKSAGKFEVKPSERLCLLQVPLHTEFLLSSLILSLMLNDVMPLPSYYNICYICDYLYSQIFHPFKPFPILELLAALC